MWREPATMMAAMALVWAANSVTPRWSADAAPPNQAKIPANCAAVADNTAAQSALVVPGTGKFGGNAGGVTNRISDRLFVGKALDANAGNNEFGPVASFGDWLSRQFGPYTVGPAQFVALTTPGANIAMLGGARTSDTAERRGGYTFGSAAIGVNDNLGASTNMTTLYGETWSWANTGYTLGHESDLINIDNPRSAQISPYSITGNGRDQLIANHWLSNGRSDILTVSIGGRVTGGDVVSLIFTGGFKQSPQRIAYTARRGDTTAAIAAGLVAAIRANTALLSSNHFYANNVGAVLAILGFNIQATAYSSRVSGAASETVVFGRPGNASVAIGILNNNTSPYDPNSGSYKSGVVFDRYTLVGSDGSDRATCCAEAIAVARDQSIDFYTSGDRPGLPQARIYSEATSASGFAQSFAFANAGLFANAPRFIVRPATDLNLVARPHQVLSSGMNLASLDNALRAVKPLEIQGSPLRLIGLDSLPAIGRFSVDSSGDTSTASLDVSGHFAAHGSDISITSGFGASPSVVGNSVAGRVTVGSGGASSGVLTFANHFTSNAPACAAQDETRASPIRAAATAATLTITGTMVALDKITYHCIGLL